MASLWWLVITHTDKNALKRDLQLKHSTTFKKHVSRESALGCFNVDHFIKLWRRKNKIDECTLLNA